MLYLIFGGAACGKSAYAEALAASLPGPKYYLATMDPTCSMDIRTVKGAKNVLFGGEGFFHTVITGPGHVVLQTMSVVEFTARIAAMVPSKD